MVVTVHQLRHWLDTMQFDSLDEVKVEINDTMETRLVVVPSLPKRLKGDNSCLYYNLPSYEAGTE